jgi:hypothetical protein
MRFVILSSILAASAAFASAPAMATEHIKPGLWSVTVNSGGMAALSAIPPAQLDKLRALGVKIPQISKAGITTQTCVPPDMTSLDQAVTAGARKMGCTAQNGHFEGNTYSVDMVCDNDRVKGSGTTTGTFVNDRSFTADTQFKGTVNGMPVDEKATTTGKWVGADCGSVKPLTRPSGN